MAAERKEQILAAFMECIRHNGLADSTIARVAEEAGLQRTLIFHYFGNRETLITSVITRIVDNYAQGMLNSVAASNADNATAMLEYLFDGQFTQEPRDTVVMGELISLGARDPKIAGQLRELYNKFLTMLEIEIGSTFKHIDAARRRRTAYAIMCLAEQNFLMNSIGFDKETNALAKETAGLLLSTLKDENIPRNETLAVPDQ